MIYKCQFFVHLCQILVDDRANSVLEQADPVLFCGINNTNILLLKNLYPKIRIIARGNTVKAVGEEGEVAVFAKKLPKLKNTSSNTIY